MNVESLLIWLVLISIILGLFFALKVAAANFYCVQITGDSMEPIFSNGVYLKFERTQDVNVGDVIEYYDANRDAYIVHQLLAIENGLLIAKGTNWATPDKPIERKMVTGKWTGEFARGCITMD